MILYFSIHTRVTNSMFWLCLSLLALSAATASTYTRIGSRDCLDHPTPSRFATVTSLDSEIARCKEVCDSLGVACVAFEHETVVTGGNCRFFVSFATDEYTFLGNGSCMVDVYAFSGYPPLNELYNTNSIQDCGSQCSGLSGHIGFDFVQGSNSNTCVCYGYNASVFSGGTVTSGTPNINGVSAGSRSCYTYDVAAVFDAKNLSRSVPDPAGTDVVLALTRQIIANYDGSENCEYYAKDTDYTFLGEGQCNRTHAPTYYYSAVVKSTEECRDVCSDKGPTCVGFGFEEYVNGSMCFVFGNNLVIDFLGVVGSSTDTLTISATTYGPSPARAVCYVKKTTPTMCSGQCVDHTLNGHMWIENTDNTEGPTNTCISYNDSTTARACADGDFNDNDMFGEDYAERETDNAYHAGQMCCVCGGGSSNYNITSNQSCSQAPPPQPTGQVLDDANAPTDMPYEPWFLHAFTRHNTSCHLSESETLGRYSSTMPDQTEISCKYACYLTMQCYACWFDTANSECNLYGMVLATFGPYQTTFPSIPGTYRTNNTFQIRNTTRCNSLDACTRAYHVTQMRTPGSTGYCDIIDDYTPRGTAACVPLTEFTDADGLRCTYVKECVGYFGLGAGQYMMCSELVPVGEWGSVNTKGTIARNQEVVVTESDVHVAANAYVCRAVCDDTLYKVSEYTESSCTCYDTNKTLVPRSGTNVYSENFDFGYYLAADGVCSGTPLESFADKGPDDCRVRCTTYGCALFTIGNQKCKLFKTCPAIHAQAGSITYELVHSEQTIPAHTPDNTRCDRTKTDASFAECIESNYNDYGEFTDIEAVAFNASSGECFILDNCHTTQNQPAIESYNLTLLQPFSSLGFAVNGSCESTTIVPKDTFYACFQHAKTTGSSLFSYIHPNCGTGLTCSASTQNLLSNTYLTLDPPSSRNEYCAAGDRQSVTIEDVQIQTCKAECQQREWCAHYMHWYDGTNPQCGLYTAESCSLVVNYDKVAAELLELMEQAREQGYPANFERYARDEPLDAAPAAPAGSTVDTGIVIVIACGVLFGWVGLIWWYTRARPPPKTTETELLLY